MKKLIIIILFILISMCFKNDEIRVRIISNSNLEEDIYIKNKVKERVEIFLNNIDSNPKKYINDNINKLSIELNEIVSCRVTFEKHIFMNKAYNNVRLNNDEYLTLLVVIENGMGDNWWTTLYPPNNMNPTTIKYKSWILERIE